MEASILFNIILDITSATGMDDLFRSFEKTMKQYFSTGDVAVYTILRNREMNHKTGEPYIAAIALYGQICDIEDIESEPELSRCYKTRIPVFNRSSDNRQTHIYYPLMESAEAEYIIRISGVADLKKNSGYGLHGIGNIIRILQNQLKLIRLKDTDYLTGLLNRHALSRALSAFSQEITEPCNATAAHPYTHLAIFDIDHFKEVNDKYGHMIGDEVLILIAQMLKQELRFHDLKYRFGGEEFIILLRDVSDDHARVLLERIRENVESRIFPIVGRMTVSAGFTLMTPEEHSTVVIDRADRALYYAKNHGRNMICSYEVLVEKKLIEPVKFSPPQVIYF